MNPILKTIEQHKKANQEIIATTSNIQELYQNTRIKLNKKLQNFVLSSQKNDFYGKALVNAIEVIQEEYSHFEEAFREEMGRAIPYVAESYYLDALHDTGAKVLGKFNAQRVDVMLQDTFTHIAGATQRMSSSEVGNLRSVCANVFRESTMQGLTRKETSNRILQGLTNIDNGFKFTDAKGRVWNNEAYTAMLARTCLLNAGRQSYFDTCIEEGYDAVRISVSGSPCPKCAVWENRVVSLTGKTKNLPTLQEAINSGLFHPNCTHSTSAIDDYSLGEDFDSSGRAKKGLNSKGKEVPPANDEEANRAYRRQQAISSARKAVDWKYANQIDKYWENMPKAHSQAILDYTNKDMHGLNKAMRNDSITPAQAKEIATLSDALKDYPKFEGDVYRSVTFKTSKERDKFLREFQNNSYADEFASTSVAQSTQKRYIYKTSKNFDNPNIKYPVCMNIKNTKSGSYIGHKSKVPTDKEVLFDVNTRFEVLDFHEKDGILYINAKEKD